MLTTEQILEELKWRQTLYVDAKDSTHRDDRADWSRYWLLTELIELIEEG